MENHDKEKYVVQFEVTKHSCNPSAVEVFNMLARKRAEDRVPVIGEYDLALAYGELFHMLVMEEADSQFGADKVDEIRIAIEKRNREAEAKDVARLDLPHP